MTGNIINIPQLILLYISFYFFKILVKKERNTKWVIGVSEIASILYLLSNTLKEATTVCFDKNRFYSLDYDYVVNIKNRYLKFIYKIFYGPLLLGYLANKNTHFLYIWSTGFLFNREDEFKFLKSIDKKIVCVFLGSEIRSPKLLLEYCDQIEYDHFLNYISTNNIIDLKKESKISEVARIADKYSNIIFSCSIDQKSYLKSKQFFIPYMYDEKKFNKNSDIFKVIKKVKILHAPSKPLVKGTSLVRAAIKKLIVEGYDIDYVEIQNMPNEVVLEHLKSTHIVLNQFYVFVPGVFGIESMANNCAVLMSADPSIETGLPQDSKDAWMITRYWEVYDNLKYLLDNPKKIKYYADNGYNFAYKHYTYEAAGEYINKVLVENDIID
jgi:hypothetical protein